MFYHDVHLSSSYYELVTDTRRKAADKADGRGQDSYGMMRDETFLSRIRFLALLKILSFGGAITSRCNVQRSGDCMRIIGAE